MAHRERISQYSSERVGKLVKELGPETARQVLGVSKAQLAAWQRGTGYVTGNDLRRVNTAFKVDVAWAKEARRVAADKGVSAAKADKAISRFLQHAAKIKKTKDDKTEIIDALLDLKMDVHKPDTYIH